MARNNSSDRHYNDQRSCAHAWAHGHSERGHASNFFFEGKTIYSYGKHFPIATIDGGRVFFTDQANSQSTSQHKSIGLSSVSHKRIIYVHHVPSNAMIRYASFYDVENIKFWTQEINSLAMEITSHPRKKSLVAKLNLSIGRLNTFLTELDITPSAKVAAILADPSIANIVSLHQSDLKDRAKQERLRIARLRKKIKVDLRLWESGELDRILPYPAGDNTGNLALLRIHPAEDRIETSKGIEVPIPLARKFWQFILTVLPAGCQECNYSILGFKVDEISPNFIRIGCHAIPMTQAIKIARLLKWRLPRVV